jgi:MtN3 and saliva related transmembrane protein
MTVVGYLAGVLTTACWLPQIARSWRTRSREDVSWGYLGALGAGVILWCVFGLSEGNLPLVLTNVVTFGAIVFLSWIKMRSDASD